MWCPRKYSGRGRNGFLKVKKIVDFDLREKFKKKVVGGSVMERGGRNRQKERALKTVRKRRRTEIKINYGRMFKEIVIDLDLVHKVVFVRVVWIPK